MQRSPAAVAVAGSLLLLWLALTSGQYFEDPTLFYKPIQFDSQLRGQYNVTKCVAEILNCWEYMRPDVLCSDNVEPNYFRDYETYCTVLKTFCNDRLGDFDAYAKRFIAFTGYCKSNSYSEHGRWT